jgi:hypothetical protein
MSQLHIPQHVREAMDKSPNASPRNNIIVTELSENLYSARWNLQPHGLDLEILWETNCEKQVAK